MPQDQKRAFIAAIASYSDEVTAVLRPLLKFPHLPAKDEWIAALDTGQTGDSDDWNKLANGVAATNWHQSQEATDCRWIKFLCQVHSGKAKFFDSIPDIKETVRGVFEYPNYGDLKHIRRFIRASEIMPGRPEEAEPSEWSKHFWDFCFRHTACIPEQATDGSRYEDRQERLSKEMETARDHYVKATADVHHSLIDHFFSTSQTSAVDSRHEGAFGLAMYALDLLSKLCFIAPASQ